MIIQKMIAAVIAYTYILLCLYRHSQHLFFKTHTCCFQNLKLTYNAVSIPVTKTGTCTTTIWIATPQSVRLWGSLVSSTKIKCVNYSMHVDILLWFPGEYLNLMCSTIVPNMGAPVNGVCLYTRKSYIVLRPWCSHLSHESHENQFENDVCILCQSWCVKLPFATSLVWEPTG